MKILVISDQTENSLWSKNSHCIIHRTGKEAAELGDAEAQCKTGYEYYIRHDRVEALNWFKKAAEQNYAGA